MLWKVEDLPPRSPADRGFSTHGKNRDSRAAADTPAERRALLVEEVADLTEVLEVYGLMVLGSQGQQVLNPALAARRAALEAIRRLDASSPPEPGTDDLDEFLDEGNA